MMMKNEARLLFGLVMAFAISSNHLSEARPLDASTKPAIEPAIAQTSNAISGTVFGESNRPVPDVYVELLDDVNATIRRVKTSGSGRFEFIGLANGRYQVKVLPYGTDYLEQIQEVTLGSVSSVVGAGSDRQYVDLYLRVNERANAGPFSAAPGVIFAQEVPEAARRLYQEALRQLRDKKEEEGFESLKKAIEAFPKYYLALDRLGAEYALRGHSDHHYYEAGLILLSKAVEVNPSGFSSLFGLGWTQYQLGLAREAIESLRRAAAIYGKSPELYLWLGKALKRNTVLDQAEVALKRAKELGDGKLADVSWELAGLYSDQRRYREAADELELFLKREPKAADAEKIRALIKQLREKPEGS